MCCFRFSGLGFFFVVGWEGGWWGPTNFDCFVIVICVYSFSWILHLYSCMNS